MNRIRIKICGITRPADALAAASAGADAIGLVFYPGSPRRVDIDTARAICRALPPFITRVGVFVDARRDEIQTILDGVKLDLLQFHGGEKPGDCIGYTLPYIKAVRMADEVNLPAQVETYRDAAGLLLDTYVAGTAGGTGLTFDWDHIPPALEKPLILAGGLDAGNVLEAVRRVRPYAVDVSGGVESGKGVKDAEKIKTFIRQVRKFDHE